MSHRHAVPLGLLDHFQGDAVFNATGGVLAIQLDEDAHALIRAGVLEFYDRSVADSGQDAFIGQLRNHIGYRLFLFYGFGHR